MSKKFSTKLKEGNWVDWEDGVKIRIRPFPISQTVTDLDRTSMKFMSEIFNYCIVGWEGMIDDEDKPIPCNAKMKLYMFDHFAELVNFVISAVSELMAVEDREAKN